MMNAKANSLKPSGKMQSKAARATSAGERTSHADPILRRGGRKTPPDRSCYPENIGLSSAFSLVEIVLALGLVSFSMLAIFAMVAQGQKTSRESRLESVAALLAGKVSSELRASSAWDTGTDYTGSSTLSDIADPSSGMAVTRTNYYDGNLSTNTSSSDRQFAVRTEVGPVLPTRLVSSDPDVNTAISHLPGAANTVLLNVEVSYPAQAPEANRSKRNFSSIITRTSKN